MKKLYLSYLIDLASSFSVACFKLFAAINHRSQSAPANSDTLKADPTIKIDKKQKINQEMVKVISGFGRFGEVKHQFHF